MATGSLGTRRSYIDVAEPPEPGRSADDQGGRRRGIVGWYNDVPAQMKGLLAFVLIFATMFAQSAFAYRTSIASERSADLVANSDRVIDAANSALGSMIDMETGLRGFYVTGDEAFLVSYNNGRITSANSPLTMLSAAWAIRR